MPGRDLKRILLVEDDPDVRLVARLALGSEFTVQACSSGEQALAAVTTSAPDLVLMDVMMPRLDGPATLAMLRSLPAGADLPVIFLTARAQPQELERYRSMGALGVIPKPFEPETLADEVRRLWNGAHG
jgi:CheY-like chemotaxis protein